MASQHLSFIHVYYFFHLLPCASHCYRPSKGKWREENSCCLSDVCSVLSRRHDWHLGDTGCGERVLPWNARQGSSQASEPHGRFSQLGIYKRVWAGKMHAKFKSPYAFKWKLSDSSRFKYTRDSTCARTHTHSRHLHRHLWFSQQTCEPGSVPFLPWEDSERLDHFLKSHICLTGKAGNWNWVF